MLDTILTILFWIIQGGMAGLGVYVSLKPQPKENHKPFIVAFVVLFVLGGTVNTFQTIRNGRAQDALQNDIRELKGGQQRAFVHITNLQFNGYGTGQPISVNESFGNASDAPANKTKVRGALYVVDLGTVNQDGQAVVSQEMEAKTFEAFLAKIESPEMGVLTLGKGENHFITAYGPAIDNETRNALISRKKTILLASELRWTDSAGDHVNELCAWLEGDRLWHYCKQHNSQKP